MNRRALVNERTASEVLGYPSLAEYAASVNPDPVDPERINVGDVFSFIYMRGARAGQRQTAKLHKKEMKATGLLLECEEIIDGKVSYRKYWPVHTRGARYDAPASQGTDCD